MKIIYFILLVFFTSARINAQSLSQEVIGSAGDYYSNGNENFSWTLGEVMIETYKMNSNYLTQGFHQPLIKSLLLDDEYEFFNGFSPNVDGINDYWKIPFLVKYPINKVSIVNRWGDVVWIGLNYNNEDIKFEGKNMNNVDLPDGTYYFMIEFAVYVKNGWVFIKR